jgi:hypothetical protein
MSDNTTTEPKKSNGLVAQFGPEARVAETDMVYKLKTAIDQRGRYAYRLNDMASGFAAGRGVTPMEARAEIETSFRKTFGKSPQEYLDAHYEQLREHSSKLAASKGRGGGR